MQNTIVEPFFLLDTCRYFLVFSKSRADKIDVLLEPKIDYNDNGS